MPLRHREYNTPMKNLKNVLLLKQLYQLKQLGYKYTSSVPYKEDNPNLALPNTLASLKKQAIDCHLCDLSKSRQKVIFGEGNPHAKLMLIGDTPSTSDDNTGKIFTGRSGELLTKMIENVLGLTRDDVYITNILKCKSLDSQSPSPTFAHTCHPYLLKEITLVKPKIILTLGKMAYYYLTNDDTQIDKVHGILQKQEEYTIIPTYHPSYLLRNPSAKKEVFEVLKKTKELL